MASTGCTPAQAWADWDLPSLVTQLRYWRKHPPLHQLVAAYLDYKPGVEPGSAKSAASNEAAIAALMASAPEMPEHLKTKIPRHV